MVFRSAWTGFLLLVVMAVACFGPACGVACAARTPCHDAMAMPDCDGMMGPSVQASSNHVAACAQDDAVVELLEFEVHSVAGVVVAYPGWHADGVEREGVVAAVRGGVKAPPRPVVVMRV